MKTSTVVPINMSSRKIADVTQINDPVESEKLDRALKADQRYKIYKEILHNSYTDKIPSKVALYGFGGVVLGILCNCITTLIPMHNVIEQPEYFLESILVAAPGIPVYVGQMQTFLRYWMNTSCLSTLKNFSFTALFCVIYGISINVPIYLIWSGVYGYPFPMPFHTFLKATTMMFFAFLVLWYQFPLQHRRNKNFKRRFRYFIYSVLLNYVQNFEYNILGRIFSNVATERQWILAALLPLVREVNVWMHLKVVGKAAGTNDDSSVIISSSHNINTRHTVFLTVMLGTEATDLSSWILLGEDFLINTYLAAKIIWIKKRRMNSDKNDKEMFECLFTLTINELVEIVVPLAFLICFLTAYYGPNAELIGNVKSTYFHFKPIESIDKFINSIVLLLIVDFLGLVLTIFVLWYLCQVNFLRAYMVMQQEFWPVITVVTVFNMYMVSLKRYMKVYISSNYYLVLCFITIENINRYFTF